MTDTRDTRLAARLARGVALFNAGRFWDAHEAWEDEWREIDRDAPDHRFVQGLIQAAAALHHATNGNARGLDLLRARAVDKLSSFAPVHGGVDVAQLIQSLADVDATTLRTQRPLLRTGEAAE